MLILTQDSQMVVNLDHIETIGKETTKGRHRIVAYPANSENGQYPLAEYRKPEDANNALAKLLEAYTSYTYTTEGNDNGIPVGLVAPGVIFIMPPDGEGE